MNLIDRWLNEEESERQCPSCGSSSAMHVTVASSVTPELIGLECQDCKHREVL